MFNTIFTRKIGTPGTGVGIDGKNIKLVVGLGNPGEKYKNTYHNAGAIFVDHLLESMNASAAERTAWKNAKSFMYAKTTSVVLAKPTVYMNDSGRSIRELLRYFGIGPEEMLIAHDDSDLELGSYKISYGRGSAGHNGRESIMKTLKNSEFSRLRLGTRNRTGKAGDFVLENIKSEELASLMNLFDEIETANFKG